MNREPVKTVFRWILTVFMVVAGANHFIDPAPYLGMMPSVLPWHLGLVYVSGVAEIAGGLGLILPQTRRAAAWGLVILLLAIFPANVNMAVNQLPLGDKPVPPALLWARLPLQALLIAWAYWFTRERTSAARPQQA